MGLRLVAPTKRKDSARGQFTQRIPSDLKGRLVGMTLEMPLGSDVVPITITANTQAIRYSLRTAESGEIKQRQAEGIAYLEGVYRNLRANAPISLTHKQCVALSGELYRSWAADLETSQRIAFQVEADGTVVRDYGMDLEGEAAAYVREADKVGQLGGVDLERHLGPLVDRLLLRRGIVAVDRASREMLLPEFAKALAEGMSVRARKAQGDYRPDPNAERFPEWSTQRETAKPVSVSLQGLFEAWWVEAERAGRSQSTKYSYGKAVDALAKFLAHEDAARISDADVIAFKDHLVSSINLRTGKPLDGKTIKDSYLAGLKSVFGWAYDNKKLPSNPAKDVTVKVGKRKRGRAPEFTLEERRAVLGQALAAVRQAGESLQQFSGRHWVPWLCAYTGARVGEMVQLRKRDLRQEDGRWIITITPEAGTVKDGQLREVPLHRHLVEMGFPEFVQAAPDGSFFMWTGTGRKALNTAKNRLREEVRKVVSDARVQPNHGWRHTFKTICGEVGLEGRVVDAIVGHAPRTVGDSYGTVTLKTKADALARFPRYDVK